MATATPTPTPVPSPPTISKAFSGNDVANEANVGLTFTITNPNAVPLTNVGVVDNLPTSPTQMVVTSATPTNVSGCGSTAQFGDSNGGDTILLQDATLAAGATCTFTFTVSVGTGSGTYTNVTNPVSSSAGNGNTATASVTYEAPVIK